MKLSKLHKDARSRRKKKRKKEQQEEDNALQNSANQVQQNLIDQADVMPDRGPTEYGDMRKYANLDRAF